jgi:hypothetical protein
MLYDILYMSLAAALGIAYVMAFGLFILKINPRFENFQAKFGVAAQIGYIGVAVAAMFGCLDLVTAQYTLSFVVGGFAGVAAVICIFKKKGRELGRRGVGIEVK